VNGPLDRATGRRVHARARRRLRLAGTGILLAGVGGLVAVVASPAVRDPAGRVLHVVWRDVGPPPEGDVALPAATVAGVRRGSPAFLDAPGVAGGTAQRPVAHVVEVRDGEVLLRFEPGEDPTGPWRLTVHPPSGSLREALELAVPAEVRERLLGDLLARGQRVWHETLLPDLRSRLPGFLARIDPTKAPGSDKLLGPVTDDVLQRLKPHFDALAEEVTQALKRKYDLLDRMGILWKFLRGDADGLKREVLPVAEETARAWWAAHREEVLRAAGEGLRAQGPAIEAWVQEEVLAAARDELLEPMWDAHAAALETELRAWAALAADEVALDPRGGFRTRFAALLRHHLLGDASSLLLLERGP
jgi:hypothetical protein